MKKEYTSPELEITKFEITTSLLTESGDDVGNSEIHGAEGDDLG